MTSPTKERNEIERLRHRLEEAEGTLAAIRAGEVDALLVGTEQEAVFTLETPDRPYRLLVSHKREPAVVLSCDGDILACNSQFARVLERPVESLVGTPLTRHVPPERREPLRKFCGSLTIARDSGLHATLE